ncbi:MAG: hypothetical protein ABEJ79_05210 [Halolamina sp.]
MSCRLLLASGVLGLVTGVLALSGVTVAVVVHALGAALAIAFPAVAAASAGDRRVGALTAGMVATSVVGTVWFLTGGGAAAAVHVLSGVGLSAAAVVLGMED